MPVLVCPSCRGSLTAAPAAAPYVVGCPHCRQPLTVPPFAQEQPAAEESPFEVPKDARPRSRNQRAKAGSGRIWVLAGSATLVVAIVVAVVLFVPGAPWRDNERRQMDSLYSDLLDHSNAALDQMPSERAADPDFAQSTAMLNVADRVDAARKKLSADYKAKYGADPTYLKPKDRVRQNPMALRYPTDRPR